MHKHLLRATASLCAAAALSLATLAPAHAAAPTGTRLMHRDISSTDSVPWAGPRDPRLSAWSVPGASCSTLFQGSDGMVVGLCTKYVGVQNGLNVIVPSVALFDPHSAQLLASHELHKDGLLGGVYGYLDEADRVVIAEGHDIVRIGYNHTDRG
ncbi:hypothetical protein EKI50_09370 [Corynebacterium sanguinis]|nr:hypothetical protein [Corynebacterium sanguinis]TVS21549.1 hypothetical protein EKI50_09370 [Corynebacterium sanguinis]